ncbi:uncharacterized protein LOC144432075 [Styela clava]
MVLILFFLVLLASNALLSTASELQKCYPQVRMEIDAHKLSKTTWYTGLQTNDAVASIIPCARLTNFTATESGFGVLVKERGVRFVQLGLCFSLRENGIYYLTKSDNENDQPAINREMNGLHDKVLLDIEEYLAEGYPTFLTDYENYFAVFDCPPNLLADEAHRMIWGYFPSPNPTLSQVAAFINVLHDVGISANFQASTCSETNWSQA